MWKSGEMDFFFLHWQVTIISRCPFQTTGWGKGVGQDKKNYNVVQLQ